MVVVINKDVSDVSLIYLHCGNNKESEQHDMGANTELEPFFVK